jgi:AraC-like DNA-binding protein
MSIILLIGAFEAIFLLLLLASKPQKRPSDRYLGLLFALYALTIGGAYLELYNYEQGYSLPAFLNLSWLLLLLHGPALWLYIQALTVPQFRFRAIHLLHLLPFVIFFILHGATFMFLPAAEKIVLVQSEAFREGLMYPVSVLAIGISTLSYNIWALLLIRRHRQRLMQSHSQLEGLDLEWLKILTIASLCLYVVNVLLFNLNNLFFFASYIELTLIAYIFAAVYVFVLGYFGLRQANVFTNHAQAAPDSETPALSPAAAAKSPEAEFLQKLLGFMEQGQPYLDPDITLGKLSSQLKVRPEQLSEAINAQLGQNFFDFVNRYRIEEFKIQCLKGANRHLSILGLAYECGFNSKAAFYRAFKKFEKSSPNEYLKRVSA